MKLEVYRNTWQEWKQKRCEEKSTEICNDWDAMHTPAYRKEEQSGYDSHPAQAKTWMLLVQHYGTILSMHMTSESELKKNPQTRLACKNTRKFWCKMCAVCLNQKIISSNSTARCELPGRCHWHSRSVNNCWVIKSREVITGYHFKYILYKGINIIKRFQLAVFLKDEEKPVFLLI